MRVKIFEYKGYVGIDSDPNSEGLVAKPGGGSLGVVMDASKADISPKALELIKKVRKGRDGLGEIDVFGTTEKPILGWLGGYKKAFKPEEIESSRDFNPNLLKSVEGVEAPDGFKKFIDTL